MANDDPTHCPSGERAAFECGGCGNDKTWCSCLPPRFNPSLQRAIGQRVLRIEQTVGEPPRIYLSGGTILTFIASDNSVRPLKPEKG